MNDNIKVFAYGCLKNKRIQSILFGKELKMVPAKLNDWILYTCPEGYFGITPNKGFFVEGYIIDIKKKDLKISDLWEEVPTYQKEYLDVYIDDNTKEKVLIYTRRTDVPYEKYSKNKKLSIDYIIQEANLFMKKINLVILDK
jgi:gamma-glutamylcyclotransferase (GGCT)/AIG2-like uncharacterized protein YtfP